MFSCAAKEKDVRGMDATKQYLLTLTRQAIWKEEPSTPPEQLDWEQLFCEARAGNILSVLVSCIQKFPESLQPTQLSKLLKESVSLKKRRHRDYDMLQRIFGEADNRNIQLVLFKGPVFAHLYPDYDLRYYDDFDLLVSPEELDMTVELLESFGFKMSHHMSKQYVYCFRKDNYSDIELYTKLWENLSPKKEKQLLELGLDEEAALLNTTACGMVVTTLGYEQHLIYQMHHIAKLLLFQGMELRHYVDVTLYVNQYIHKIDVAHFWESMKNLQYRKFAEIFCQICVHYFGMKKEFLPEGSWQAEVTEQWITTFFRVGLLGCGCADTRIASAIVYQSYFSNRGEKPSRKKMWRVTLFPRIKDLSGRYRYAKQHKWLLPVAWFHRAIRYVLTLVSKKRKKAVSEPMRQAEEKMVVLEKMGLLKR